MEAVRQGAIAAALVQRALPDWRVAALAAGAQSWTLEACLTQLPGGLCERVSLSGGRRREQSEVGLLVEGVLVAEVQGTRWGTARQSPFQMVRKRRFSAAGCSQ